MPEAANPRAAIGGNKPPSEIELLKEKHKAIFDRARNWLRRAKLVKVVPENLDDCAKLEALYAEGRDIANDADRVREAEKKPHLDAGRAVDELFNGDIRDEIGADSKNPGLARELLNAAAAKRLEITRKKQAAQAEAAERARKEADKLAERAKSQEDRGHVREADVTQAKVAGLDAHADDLAARAAAAVAEASRDRVGGRTVSVDAKLVCNGVVRGELDLEALRPYFRQEDLVFAVNQGLKIKAFQKVKGAAIIEQAVGRVR